MNDKDKAINVEIDWELLGAKLANLGSGDQNKFFRGFADEIIKCCESRYHTEVQLHGIRTGWTQYADAFTDSQREVYQILGMYDDER